MKKSLMLEVCNYLFTLHLTVSPSNPKSIGFLSYHCLGRCLQPHVVSCPDIYEINVYLYEFKSDFLMNSGSLVV